MRLTDSPRDSKKHRVTFDEDGSHVDFGQRGAEDFTTHHDSARMIRYLVRHRGHPMHPSLRILSPTPNAVQRALKVVHSLPNAVGAQEKWGYDETGAPVTEEELDRAVRTAGFWSRWLLWSKPSMREAIALMLNRFNILVS